MALNGANGYLYQATTSTADTTAPALTSGSWYMITGKGSTASALPANLTSGYVFYQRTSDSPVDSTAAFTSNDAANLLTLTKLAFVTDFSESASKEKFEETVQTDSVKSYQVGSKPEKTGTVGGYWVDNNTQQQNVIKKLDDTIEQTTSDGITKTSPQTTPLRLFLSRDETTDSGAQVWEYLPCIVEGLQSDKPMEGPESFSFNYTVVGSEKPSVYILDNT